MKQLIAQRQEQRADIYKVEREDETAFTINGHQYRLVANYRDAFEPDKLGERFSTILSKYDYIVGDWGFEQLRLKGFYASSNKNAQKTQMEDAIQDYLYEYCNFGCAYFVVQNLDVRVQKSEHTNHRNRSKDHAVKRTQNKSETSHQRKQPNSNNQKKQSNRSNKKANGPQIRERKTKVNPVPVSERKGQTAVRTTKKQSQNQRFVIRHK
ncbi:hypothetical protein IV59_GL001706 [Paucilactobacillus hokkaidonensis]|nr:hypothetical protein IV59_GL001706 [Paucilactobacillus hokkaidonensis]